ncbi:uncharacterized protein LOC123658922 [Melitaea cinxia]|uniref:uncharacterized protein LOC123658922 n=1 Tax=Melitaea cinxia TaxID=113334 RepID=UPI001E274657|nr:uncharacterized protein LOC123658922 [Melitaea cinxia]
MPETEMSGLKEFLKKRSTIKGRLTKFREYITVLNQIKPADLTGAQVKEISLRLTKFQELFTSFDELQDQIELLSTDQDEQIRERDFIESQFYSLISTAQEIIDSISQSRDRAEGSVNSKPSGTCSHALNTIKLPTIKLPNFDGNYLKWLEFRDTFDSLINSNDTIPTINKFHYLRSALEGSATVVIKSIEFTSANYRVAWDLLCERYNNKNILINNHLKALFNIEPITRESYKALRYLIDQVSKNLRALGTLGLPTEQWDVLVIFMMSSKLDINTNRKWEEYKGNLSDLPTLLEFKTFLRNRADVLETTQGTRSDKHTHDYKSNYKSQQFSKSLVAANTEVSKRIVCSICKKDHRVYLCPVFLEMSLEDRQSEVNKLKLCSNCLREGHNAHRCRLKGCCRSCKGKHNSLLHKEIAEVLKAAPVSLAIASAKEVLLCTALVDIVNPQNNSCQRARILLDTGSQSCFITTNFKNKMGLSVNRVKPVNVSGINNIGFDISERCCVQLNSRVSSFTAKLTCLIVPRITGNVPNNKIELQNLKLPLNIELADPAFYQPADIDILIGADVFWDIIGTQQIKLGQDKPTLLDSKLGWLVSGPVGKSTCNDNFMCNFTQLDIYESMKRFWEVEELPTTKDNLFSVEEQLCETHFVNNTSRVIEINDLTKGFAWMHVPTDQNPADLVSRGIDPQQLQDSTLWWRGPSFLAKEESEWPIQGSFATNNLPELKVFTCTKVDTKINNCSLVKFEKYSRYDKLKRIVAYVLRFINKCRKNAVSNDVIEPEELENSLMLLVKQAQLESFANELYTIAKDKSLPLKSKLLPLDPFIDTLGILRVGGRLQNSKFDFNKKHPILLDGKHHFSKILMRHEHFRLLHAGPQLLLAAVREEFWLIGGRNLARSVTRKCIVCARMRGQVIKPIMGTLPSVRVSSSFAFDTCGIDFAGPFLIASKKGRGSNITKCFLALFVCLQTKALHLETVSSMSSDAFLLCLRRFVSRGGRPQVIYCDNVTNFVGAKNELGRVIKASRQSVSDYASVEKIKFVFSPAYAPHFGGIWEAGIKSAKSHLKRVASNASLTFEELATLFTQIEAILNSRPLSPLSSDPTDLYPLTPGHFLIGRPLMSVPSLPVTTKRPNRYEFIEQLRQHFWERWRREFIAELQQRTKWRTRQRDLQIGDMVVLKEDQLPPLRWRLGRITRLYPGPDGINRVADIFTAKGTMRRAFNKICLLPTSPDA